MCLVVIVPAIYLALKKLKICEDKQINEDKMVAHLALNQQNKPMSAETLAKREVLVKQISAGKDYRDQKVKELIMKKNHDHVDFTNGKDVHIGMYDYDSNIDGEGDMLKSGAVVYDPTLVTIAMAKAEGDRIPGMTATKGLDLKMLGMANELLRVGDGIPTWWDAYGASTEVHEHKEEMVRKMVPMKDHEEMKKMDLYYKKAKGGMTPVASETNISTVAASEATDADSESEGSQSNTPMNHQQIKMMPAMKMPTMHAGQAYDQLGRPMTAEALAKREMIVQSLSAGKDYRDQQVKKLLDHKLAENNNLNINNPTELKWANFDYDAEFDGALTSKMNKA